MLRMEQGEFLNILFAIGDIDLRLDIEHAQKEHKRKCVCGGGGFTSAQFVYKDTDLKEAIVRMRYHRNSELQ